MTRALAFHLPQFHPIQENNEWWGNGFTEWTNTAKARRLYPGHYQPHVPADLGFYDLRNPESRAQQAELAARFGVEGFVYWYYWFGHGRRLLERPVAEILASGDPKLPFCLAWANQTWTGVWHGAPERVLVEQEYPGHEDDRAHFQLLLEAFRDARYIRVDDKPLLYVFRPEQLPDASEWVTRWQKMAIGAGLPGLYLVAEMSDLLGAGPIFPEPFAAGFDAAVHVRIPVDTSSTALARMRLLRRLGLPEIYRYAEQPVLRPPSTSERPVFPCVYPGWDNTPRAGRRGLVAHGATPEHFRTHVHEAVQRVADHRPDQRLVFIKSWNEWAEGNHMEPDLKWGLAFLEALRDEVGA
jgi:lipopolysaccharide biosynthesis protein